MTVANGDALGTVAKQSRQNTLSRMNNTNIPALTPQVDDYTLATRY